MKTSNTTLNTYNNVVLHWLKLFFGQNLIHIIRE